ncbi:hypothetical protein BTO06_04510 [Tenacibaculum sp. SZ-18]|uniref:sensor histidine kinase n=1 Tax=Tenacibaculum sp. SZ-18 TaxID=754423 RepID=UPI000C2D3029|nr:sensor histidine kinase [Tenacibaculum sp. SZ-18]AUC14450.1 hypothetical protein BTO06_04510 [Tenacibaculum sp. SZ-18]
MNKVTRYLFYILFLFFVETFSQNPVSIQLTEKDGLPDIEFYGAVEDKEGFIWLAADKGLFRYDGKRFKNYTHPDKRGLSVFGIKLDDEGRVWCNNISGQFFYLENDSLHLFKDLKKEAKGQLTNFIFFKNKLVIYYYREIILVDLKDANSIKKISDNKKTISTYKENDALFHIIEEQKFISNDGESFNLQKSFKNKLYSDYYNIYWSFIPFKRKRFFLGYEQLTTNTTRERNTMVMEMDDKLVGVKLPDALKFSKNIIDYYIYEDLLWLGTEDGVYVCDYQNKELIIKDHFFKGKTITKIIKDRNNNYWFTTLRNGIFIVPNINLKKLELDFKEANITAMSKIGNDKIIFGSSKGNLQIVNINSNRSETLPHLKEQKIFAISAINKDSILVGYKSHTALIDINDYSSKPIQSSYFKGVKDFSFVSSNKILLACYNKASFISLKPKEINEVLLGKIRAYTTHFSEKNNKKYVGFVNGTRIYDKENKEVHLLHKGKDIFTVDIGETKNGIIWLSTFKNGILGIQNDSISINYTMSNGLLSNLTREIKGDGDNLWISTTNGIQVLNTKTRKFRNLTRRDGINSYDITDIIPFEDKLFFSSNKGVIKVDRDKIFKRANTLKFYFTNISVNDINKKIESNYKLKSDENKIQFDFQINGFLAEENIQYGYQLIDKGMKEKWNLLDQNINQITFNNLASGEYKFVLKATSIDDPKNEFSKTVTFSIALPIYKEWWFVFLIFLSGVLIVWYRFNQRIKTIRETQKAALEKERLQRELVSTKLETLRSQMNPHFTFNALNSIQNLILKNDKKEAYNYLTKFSTLIRENLHLSTKTFVVFEKELSLIKRYLDLESLRFKETLKYNINVGDNVEEVKIPTMIIQPYVENAIKHGLLHKKDGIRKLEIEFYLEDKVLVSKISDNGIGIEKAEQIQKRNQVKKKSFSTESIRERLSFLREYYNTDIGVEYPMVDSGTTVIIKIPYFI